MITIQDLVKYGLARDIEPLKKTAVSETSARFEREIDRLNSTIGRDIAVLQEANKGQSSKAKSLERAYGKNLDRIEAEKEKAFGQIEKRYQSEIDRQKRMLEQPETIRQVSALRSAEQQKELDRIRGEKETVQRESAEREVSRRRARGGRGSRQMLANARLAPQQMGIGGESTLGAAPFN